MRPGALITVACVLLAIAPASAQFAPARPTTPCVLDRCLDAPGGPATPAAPPFVRRGAVAPGAFDFYVLALSWSPGFCDTGGDAKSPDQCAAGRNLGFVVHGLWPQNMRGFPSNCDGGSRFPSRAVIESVGDLYPDPGLARHEWRTHGTCTGLSPADYFSAVRQARGTITIPQTLRQPGDPQILAPLDITRAFVAANQGLRADMLAVTCRQGELQEVRLCLSKDLRSFQTCPEVSRDSCRTPSISVLPAR